MSPGIPKRVLSYGMKTLSLATLRLLPLVFSTGALATGVYLLIFALTQHDTLRACGGGDCQEVLNSSWSEWYDIPVVAFGVTMYGTYFVAYLLLVLSGDHAFRMKLRLVLVFVATLIVLGAVYFFVIQGAVLGAFCGFCMVAHLLGVLAVVTGWTWSHVAARIANRDHDRATSPSPSSRPTQPSGPERDMAGTMLSRQLGARRRQIPEFPSWPQWTWGVGLAGLIFILFAVSHILDPGPVTHLVLDAPSGAPAGTV